MEERDEIAKALLPEVYREYQTSVRSGDAEPSMDWRRDIARSAYKMADAFLQVRANQPDRTPPMAPPPTSEYVGGK